MNDAEQPRLLFLGAGAVVRDLYGPALAAVGWLERAASHGYVEAQALLGALCVHGLANGTTGGLGDR